MIHPPANKRVSCSFKNSIIFKFFSLSPHFFFRRVFVSDTHNLKLKASWITHMLCVTLCITSLHLRCCKHSTACPSLTPMGYPRGPWVSYVSPATNGFISSSGQRPNWLRVCCPDPEPWIREVSQGPGRGWEWVWWRRSGWERRRGETAIKHNRGRPIRMCLL